RFRERTPALRGDAVIVARAGLAREMHPASGSARPADVRRIRMDRMYRVVPLLYFIAATALLMVLAIVLLANAAWDLIMNLGTAARVDAALNSIGLLIIGFAVIETAKFIAEEEILRKRELRSPRESRRSITKFISIIVIAASLE